MAFERPHKSVRFFPGDCIEAMKGMGDNTLDSVVTDPPYHLQSVVKRFGSPTAAPLKDYEGGTGVYKRSSAGFLGKQWDTPVAPVIDPAFANWFAGFVDGEGCFHVHKKTVNGCETYDCQFSITLRDDDYDIIVEIQRQLGGIGTIASRSPNGSSPQVRYCVSSQRDCLRLREVLSVFILRAKKVRDFEIWSKALDAWLEHEPGESWEEVAYFRNALMAVRRYGASYHPEQLFHYQWAREAHRIMKPGAYLVAFGGTTGWHRMVCSIEDAGFEIKDSLTWITGQGFPKSHSVSRGIDRKLGVKDSEEALQWDGFGSAIKPSHEPICLARKPLSEGTIAENVLAWGCGALNIDGCRLDSNGDDLERWPSNVCISEEIAEYFPNSKYFYCAKADKEDRAGSRHPTVKPVALLQWLIRLITPPNGWVFDPFAGSGTTGHAALLEGFHSILCENEAEYQDDIRRRFADPALLDIKPQHRDMIYRRLSNGHARPARKPRGFVPKELDLEVGVNPFLPM
jgi:DNA modification methylase